MKKLVCIILTAMMLMLCSCESSDESSAVDSGTNTKASTFAYTKKISIDNVSFCVPEECEEKTGSGNIMYYYYPDSGFIMTSYNDNKYNSSVHNDVYAESLIEGMKQSSSVKNLRHEKTFFGNIPILQISMELNVDSTTAYNYSAYLQSSNYILQLGACSYISYDDAKAKYDDLIGTIELSKQETKKQDIESSVPEKNFTEKLLYNKNRIKVTLTGIEERYSGAELKVRIENNSSYSYTVQCRDFAINDYSLSTVFSTDVGAGKKAVDSITVYGMDDAGITLDKIKTVELRLHFFDSDNWSNNFDSDLIYVTL